MSAVTSSSLKSEDNMAARMLSSGHNLFIDLPTGLVTAILTSWLHVKHIARLDFAFCSNVHRNAFLDIFRSKGFVIGDAVNIGKYKGYWPWLASRGVKVRSVILCGRSADERLLEQYLTTLAGDHTHTLMFQEMSSSDDRMINKILSTAATSCRKLSRVLFKKCFPLTGFETVLAANCGHLKSISMRVCDTDVPILPPSLILPHVYRMTLEGQLSAATVNNLLQACPHLTSLLLMDCHIDEICATTLCAKASILQSLCLDECHGITDNDATSLSMACVHLKQLRLLRCPLLTDPSAIAFAEHCPALEGIMLEGAFSNAPLLAIAKHCGARLRHLSLYSYGDGTNLTEGITALSSHCKCLHSLQCCVHLSCAPEALAALISAQPQLRQLHLSTLKLNHEVLTAIASLGPRLRLLNLHRAECPSEDGIMEIILQCTGLRRVVVQRASLHISALARKLWQLRQPELVFAYTDEMIPYWGDLT